MSLLGREAKVGIAGRLGLATDPQWPPPARYWISRDTHLNGDLEDVVDVWVARPTRLKMVDFPSHYWMSDEWDLSTRWGRYMIADARAKGLTIPDDDRMLIVVG